MTDTTDLLRPWIRRQFGDEIPDPLERLEAFRAIIPGRLPDDYADTLLHLGRSAGLVSGAIIEAIGTPPPREPGIFGYMSATPLLSRLYGLQSNLWNVFGTWDALRDRMPAGLVPIGDQGMGDQICIDVSEAGNGRIFSWGHEEDPGPPDAQGQPGWRNTFLVATSFTDMLRRLHKAPEPPDNAPIGRICSVRR
jgi:hypothetical protein